MDGNAEDDDDEADNELEVEEDFQNIDHGTLSLVEVEANEERFLEGLVSPT